MSMSMLGVRTVENNENEKKIKKKIEKKKK